jgi:hypothetical protein
MSLNLNSHSGGGSREPLDPGAYPAKVVGIVDLGMHVQEYKGEKKDPRNEVAFTYEFLDEFLKDEDGNDLEDKPRWLTEQMAMYGPEADKAKSTSRYKALDPTGQHKGDLIKCLGAACMVTVVHNPKKEGNGVWENISGISPMRAKDPLQKQPLVHEPYFFSLDDPDIAVFLKLPEFLKKKIVSNIEFASSKLEKLLKEVGDDSPGKSTTESSPPKEAEAGDSENPY